MAVYDLSNPAERLALAKALHNPRVAAWIVEKHYGRAAVQQLREDWRKAA